MDIVRHLTGAPNYSRMKTNLRLVMNRLKLLVKKRTELALKARKDIADYIQAGKTDRARIRCEHIIREDYMAEAMEILEMYCDLLLARMGLIETMDQVDPGLEEPIASIIWATPRMQAEVPEFAAIGEELNRKFGKDFVLECKQNSKDLANGKLVQKMSITSPPPSLIERYMVLIADSYKVQYEPDPSVLSPEELDALKPPTRTNQTQPSGQVPPPPGDSLYSSSFPDVPPAATSARPTHDASNNAQPPPPGFNLPDVPSVDHNEPKPGDSMPFDDLEARFNRLKKR